MTPEDRHLAGARLALMDHVRGLQPKPRDPTKPRRKSNHGAHSALVRSVVEAITASGGFAWTNSTGAMRTGERYVRFGSPGAPDVLGVLNGRSIAIEVKTGAGRLTDQQRAWAERHQRAGGLWAEVRSLDDAAPVLARAKGDTR